MSSVINKSETSEPSAAPAEPASIWVFTELKALISGSQSFFQSRLTEPPVPRSLFYNRVIPLAAVRPVAVLLRSVVGGTPLPGAVVGLGSFALQIGTWLGLALVLPALARQFHAEISDRQAFSLTTYASMPVWLAGAFYAVPEEPAFLFLWSRTLVLLVAVFSIYLIRQGIVALGVRRKMQLPLLGGITVAAVLIYGLLFMALGISSHVALYVIG